MAASGHPPSKLVDPLAVAQPDAPRPDTGPAHARAVVVPVVQGMAAADAVDVLRGCELIALVEALVGDPVGVVLAQEPPAGGELPAGGLVTLQIATPPAADTDDDDGDGAAVQEPEREEPARPADEAWGVGEDDTREWFAALADTGLPPQPDPDTGSRPAGEDGELDPWAGETMADAWLTEQPDGELDPWAGETMADAWLTEQPDASVEAQPFSAVLPGPARVRLGRALARRGAPRLAMFAVSLLVGLLAGRLLAGNHTPATAPAPARSAAVASGPARPVSVRRGRTRPLPGRHDLSRCSGRRVPAPAPRPATSPVAPAPVPVAPAAVGEPPQPEPEQAVLEFTPEHP